MEDIVVKGKPIDKETRCEHYQSEKDIIAIKFYCCGHYYPCIKCHEETADHSVKLWPENKFNEPAVLCGKCGSKLSINEYLECGARCITCGEVFNEKCNLHHHLYFEM